MMRKFFSSSIHYFVLLFVSSKTYVVIISNLSSVQTSTGYIHFNNDDNDTKRQETVVQAVLKLNNCTNLNVTAQIRGFGASRASLLTFDPFASELYDDKVFEPKSFAFIYAHNETRSMNRFLTIGQRQINDTLVKFEKITVTNELSQYPEYEIAYNTPNTFITQVAFKFDVSSHFSVVLSLFLSLWKKNVLNCHSSCHMKWYKTFEMANGIWERAKKQMKQLRVYSFSFFMNNFLFLLLPLLIKCIFFFCFSHQQPWHF